MKTLPELKSLGFVIITLGNGYKCELRTKENINLPEFSTFAKSTLTIRKRVTEFLNKR